MAFATYPAVEHPGPERERHQPGRGLEGAGEAGWAQSWPSKVRELQARQGPDRREGHASQEAV
jgi:hypothetical protein